MEFFAVTGLPLLDVKLLLPCKEPDFPSLETEPVISDFTEVAAEVTDATGLLESVSESKDALLGNVTLGCGYAKLSSLPWTLRIGEPSSPLAFSGAGEVIESLSLWNWGTWGLIAFSSNAWVEFELEPSRCKLLPSTLELTEDYVSVVKLVILVVTEDKNLLLGSSEYWTIKTIAIVIPTYETNLVVSVWHGNLNPRSMWESQKKNKKTG